MASLKINEEEEEGEEDYRKGDRAYTHESTLAERTADDHTTPSTFNSYPDNCENTSFDSVASSIFSNRGLLNRSKFHGLGHRTTKSENFTLKLSKRQDKKSINQLNDLNEEKSSSVDAVSSTKPDDIVEEKSKFDTGSNNSKNSIIKTATTIANQNTANSSLPQHSVNNSDNSNSNSNSSNSSLLTHSTHNKININSGLGAIDNNNPPTGSHLHDFDNYNTSYFEPLPSAPVDSKHNFSVLTPSISIPQSATPNPNPSLSFSSVRKIHPLLSSSLKNSSADFLPFRQTNKLKSNKLKLPSMVKLLSPDNADDSIHNWGKLFGEDYLPNLLIIDARPFHDYCKSHMNGAINICLPSTLLKRSTFTLEKCIQTLTSKEKILFNKYFTRDPANLPTILFYDDYSASENDISSSIFYLAGKFIQHPLWNSPLYILEGGFTNFNERRSLLPDKITNSTFQKPLISLDNDLSSSSINSDTFSPSSTLLSPQSLVSPNYPTHQLTSTSITSSRMKSPVGLSRFTLPDCSHLPVFKTRNYDEVLSIKNDNSIHLSTMLTPNEVNSLPDWLGGVIGNDLGSSVLTEKFNNLQIQERARLNHALTKTDIANAQSTGERPVISAGVELGRKNRYKDIFLYEHARVKLKKYDPASKELDSVASYINASYIHYPNSKLNYIATQGPLNETIGDFWNVVYFNDVPIIFSLTPQSENHVEKCAPFWNSGVYFSNGVKIKVDLIEEVEDLQLSYKTEAKCIARRILVTVGEKPPKEVLQLHMVSWPDYSIVICEEDILSLVGMKRFICKQLNIESVPILVHCSAGCGRTGSFCVIDTCIDVLFKEEKEHKQETKDLIYEITSQFRSQRVFMVQTLRQYMLIYDSIIKFVKMHEKAPKFVVGDVLTGEGLVDWERKDPGIIKRFIETYR